jgi:cell wall-associated NlpC family hydrolase
MENGVIIKNVAKVFAEKSTDSEQVTQAIMGQPVAIEKDEGEWLWIQTWDTYHGWTRSRWVGRDISHPSQFAVVSSPFANALKEPTIGAETWSIIVITTCLEVLGIEMDLVRVRLPDGRQAWVAAKDVEIRPAGDQLLPLGPVGGDLISTGKRFLGVPYLWGGTSPFGLDCSGFVQLVYKLNGIQLLRDAHMQAEDPRAIPVEKSDLRAGDMVFYAGGQDKTRITHIGMACGDGTFIHSAGGGMGVTINNLTDEPFDRNYWGASRMPGG